MRTSFPGLASSNRQPGHHHAPPGRFVDDVNTIVLPVRSGDPEKEGQPAPEAERALLREGPLEHEVVTDSAVVDAPLLQHAVYVHLEPVSDTRRKLDARLDHAHRMPTRAR